MFVHYACAHSIKIIACLALGGCVEKLRRNKKDKNVELAVDAIIEHLLCFPQGRNRTILTLSDTSTSQT